MSVLADSYHVELIDGLEVEKQLPKRPHWVIQSFLIQWFGRVLIDRNFDVMTEANIRCGADRLVPDVSIAPTNARYVDGDLADPAILAVEILSPGQTLADILDKCNRLLKAGTQSCWIVWPEKRLAWTYSPGGLQEVSSSQLQFASPVEHPHLFLPSLPAADLWAELDRRGL